MVFDEARLDRCRREQAADLIELFSSIQGEGLRVGERHLFLRTSHCDAHCAYCDTPLCHTFPPEARVETAPGSREFRRLRNPIPLPVLADWVTAHLDAVPHRAVAFTGGEPLLQPWVLLRVAPLVRARGVAVLLETDGNLPEAFREVRGLVDVLSMDWKLPSATGEPGRPEAHLEMLRLGRGIETVVKAVFVEETPEAEVAEMARLIAGVDRDLVLVLQPATPAGAVREAPAAARALSLQEAACRHLGAVRVIPQVHRMLRMP